MSSAVGVRATVVGDHAAVLALVRSAFADDTRDGHEEVDIVEQTWALGDGVGPIDLVAVDHEVIVGHVLGARGTLEAHTPIAIAPLAVAPEHQGRGVGTQLMLELLARADHAGWPMAVLLGDPAYYRRFGFEPSGPRGIVYEPVGAGDPHFQVRPLRAYDARMRGTFVYCWEQ